MIRRPLAWPASATTIAGTPIPSASRHPFSDAPHRISGSDGQSIECRSSSTSTVSIRGRICRARSSSQDRCVLSSMGMSQSRLMSSSTKREMVGCCGSKRSKAAILTKPKVSWPRVGRMAARSSLSTTMAPAISLPCVTASTATCGPGVPDFSVVKPGMPVLPSRQGSMSGGRRRTSNRGTGGWRTRWLMRARSDRWAVGCPRPGIRRGGSESVRGLGLCGHGGQCIRLTELGNPERSKVATTDVWHPPLLAGISTVWDIWRAR